MMRNVTNKQNFESSKKLAAHHRESRVALCLSRPRATRYSLLMALCLILVPAVCFGQSTQQVSQFGITWTFDRACTFGQFANGDYWVQGPVTVIDIDPASVVSGGRTINGSMVNPVPSAAHGYDSEIAGFTASLNAGRPNNQAISSANPLVVPPGCSLISTISTPEPGGRTAIQTTAILTVLGNAPTAGSFRPPYAGSDKTVRFNRTQLNFSLLKDLPITAEIRSRMPRLHQLPGDQRTVSGADSVERMFERPWLDHLPGPSGRALHPFDNMDDYDRDITNEIGTAALMLHLDFSGESDFAAYGSNRYYKETILIRLVQIGIDYYGVIQAGGRNNYYTDTGRKFPILFAGLMLNYAPMRNIGQKSGDYAYTPPYGPGNPPPDLVVFEEDTNTFYVSQLHVAMTHSASWNPDYRNAEQIPYEQADIRLPEWGKIRYYDLHEVNEYWNTMYRSVICPAYGGIALAVHIMGAKVLWNHDVFFDYKDRFMEVEDGNREHSRFSEAMWDEYRADYGPVWTRNNPSDLYSQGHYTGGGTTPPPPLGHMRGDVSGNGDISSYDASLSAQYAVGLINLTQEQIQAADVTQNSEVSSYDASLIAQYSIGLISGF